MERTHRTESSPGACGTARARARTATPLLSLAAAFCLAAALALCAACAPGDPADGVSSAGGSDGSPSALSASSTASDSSDSPASADASASSSSAPAAQDADGLSPAERADRVIAVAERELGNDDGTVYEDALLDAGGELCYQRGYWCATFIWWSFREAGLSDCLCDGQMVVYPQRQAEFYESQGRYRTSVDHGWQPERGDLMFFFYNDGFPGGERISHSEIVLDYDARTGMVETVSANPVVEYHEHSAYDADTRGFADVDYERAA